MECEEAYRPKRAFVLNFGHYCFVSFRRFLRNKQTMFWPIENLHQSAIREQAPLINQEDTLDFL